MSCSIAYVTAAHREDALRIARTLLDEQLIACANVIEGMTSVYRWEGAVREDHEVVLILKTRTALTDRVTARVRELHPYECPCVIAWPVPHGNPDYLRWIENETPAKRDLIV